MSTVCAKGPGISQSTIDSVCRYMTEAAKLRAVSRYWEYVPSEGLSLNEQIGYIISSISNADMLDINDIAIQLYTGPDHVNSPDYVFAKPNAASYLLENKNTPELQQMICKYRTHKHCPSKYRNNDKFMLILLIAEVYDYSNEKDVRIKNCDDIYDLMCEYSHSRL